MNRQTSRTKTKPITGNPSNISNKESKTLKKIQHKRTLSTTNNKSTNNSKEKQKKILKNKFGGNDMLSPKTIEYSKSKIIIDKIKLLRNLEKF